MALKKRVISLVLVVSMVFMSVSVCTKKAEASPLVVGAAAVVAVVAFLGACGITFTLFNTDSDTFVNTVSSKMDEYAVAQGFADVAEWVVGCELARLGDTFLLNKLAVQKFAAFATWFKDNVGLTSGTTISLVGSSDSVTVSDGHHYINSIPVFGDGTWGSSTAYSVSYLYPFTSTDLPLTFQLSNDTNSYIVCSYYSSDRYIAAFYDDGVNTGSSNLYIGSGFRCYLDYTDDGTNDPYMTFIIFSDTSGKSFTSYLPLYISNSLGLYNSSVAGSLSSLSVSAADSISIPDASTMADDESLSIDTGQRPDGDNDTSTDVSKLVTAVLAALAAGSLVIGNSSVVDTPTADTTIPGLIQTVIDGITGLPAAIANAIAAIFIPSDVAVEGIYSQFNDHFPLITGLQDWANNFHDILADPASSANDLGLTLNVNLGAKSDGSYGSQVLPLINSDFLSLYVSKYKSNLDKIIVGFAWLVFLWNLYGQLPGILHGTSGGLYSTSQIMKEAERRSKDE